MNVLGTLGCKGNSLRPQMEYDKEHFSIAAVSCPVLFLIRLERES